MTDDQILRTDTVLGLTRRVLEEGFEESTTAPILADALEERGYSDTKTILFLRRKERYGDSSAFEDAVAGSPVTLNGYDSMVTSEGYQIIDQKSDGDYQGTSYWLLYDPSGDRWGILDFGFGSCSGCDSYEACCDGVDREKLRKEVLGEIEWHGSEEYARQEYDTYSVS